MAEMVVMISSVVRKTPFPGTPYPKKAWFAASERFLSKEHGCGEYFVTVLRYLYSNATAGFVEHQFRGPVLQLVVIHDGFCGVWKKKFLRSDNNGNGICGMGGGTNSSSSWYFKLKFLWKFCEDEILWWTWFSQDWTGSNNLWSNPQTSKVRSVDGVQKTLRARRHVRHLSPCTITGTTTNRLFTFLLEFSGKIWQLCC